MNKFGEAVSWKAFSAYKPVEDKEGQTAHLHPATFDLFKS